MAITPREYSLWDDTFSVTEDLSTKQFFAVKPGVADDACLLCAAASDLPVGILQNKPKTTGVERAATVRRLGKSLAVVDGNAAAIASGDWLGTDANGRLVKKTANKDYIIARANQGSTALGDVISVTLTGGFYLTV